MDNLSTSDAGLELAANKMRSLGAQNVNYRKEGNRTILSASNPSRTRTVSILTRTRKAGTWQTSIDYGRFSEERPNETSFWIFVDLKSFKDPQFYIVPESWICNNIAEVHREYLSKHGGQRARTKDSKHHAVTLKRIERWHNRWDLLGIF